MCQHQRALVLIAMLITIPFTFLPGRALALPVTGNLVVTSGQGRFNFSSPCDLGFNLQNLAGAGFSFPALFLEVGFNSACLVAQRPFRAGDSVPEGIGMQGLGVPAGRYATILGVSYAGFGAGPAEVSLGLGGVNAYLSLGTGAADSTLPPVGHSPVVLTAPFGIGGTSFAGPPKIQIDSTFDGLLFDFNLSGTGTASLTFSPCLDASFCDWRLTNVQYDLGPRHHDPGPHPIPEPATLLLWAATAVGLGVVGWLRHRPRGRQHAA